MQEKYAPRQRPACWSSFGFFKVSPQAYRVLEGSQLVENERTSHWKETIVVGVAVCALASGRNGALPRRSFKLGSNAVESGLILVSDWASNRAKESRVLGVSS